MGKPSIKASITFLYKITIVLFECSCGKLNPKKFMQAC